MGLEEKGKEILDMSDREQGWGEHPRSFKKRQEDKKVIHSHQPRRPQRGSMSREQTAAYL